MPPRSASSAASASSASSADRISVIICAHNEARWLGGCQHSVLAQSRPADEVIVVNNASSDDTHAVAASIPGVRVVSEPRKGLVIARETGRRQSTGDLLAYLDADCRAPLTWLERIERRFAGRADLVQTVRRSRPRSAATWTSR